MKVRSYTALTWHSLKETCVQQLKLPGNLPFLLSASSLTTSSSPYLLLRLEPQLKQNKNAFFFFFCLQVFAVSSPNPEPLKEQELLPRDIPVDGLCLLAL